MGEQLRGVLDLVEERRPRELVEERRGVAAHAGDHLRVLEEPIRGPGKRPPQEGRLPGPARAGENDGGEAPCGLLQVGGEEPEDVAHW
jgi:hypothetical protein